MCSPTTPGTFSARDRPVETHSCAPTTRAIARSTTAEARAQGVAAGQHAIVDVNRNPALARVCCRCLGAVVVERRHAAPTHQPQRTDADGGDHQGTRPGAAARVLTAGYGERAISERDRDSGTQRQRRADQRATKSPTSSRRTDAVPDDAAGCGGAPRRDLRRACRTRSKRTRIAAAAYWCCSSPDWRAPSCPDVAPLPASRSATRSCRREQRMLPATT